MDKFKLAKWCCCMGLKASSVDIVVNFTTEIEVMTELRSVHNRNLSGAAGGGYIWHMLSVQTDPSALH